MMRSERGTNERDMSSKQSVPSIPEGMTGL